VVALKEAVLRRLPYGWLKWLREHPLPGYCWRNQLSNTWPQPAFGPPPQISKLGSCSAWLWIFFDTRVKCNIEISRGRMGWQREPKCCLIYSANRLEVKLLRFFVTFCVQVPGAHFAIMRREACQRECPRAGCLAEYMASRSSFRGGCLTKAFASRRAFVCL